MDQAKVNDLREDLLAVFDCHDSPWEELLSEAVKCVTRLALEKSFDIRDVVLYAMEDEIREYHENQEKIT